MIKNHKRIQWSEFMKLVLDSYKQGSCVKCGTPLDSFDEAVKHWEKELEQSGEFFDPREETLNLFERK